MPVVESEYSAQYLFKNGHFSTVYSALFKTVKGIHQNRERILLSDNDFLDLDWTYASKSSDKLLIAFHGLEGSADRPYMLGVTKQFNLKGIDVVCVNFRGCSGEPNLKYRSYHSGATEDVVDIFKHILSKEKYNSIYAIGFSLGGNVLLKYLGEGNVLPNQLKSAMAVSVPVDLSGSCVELHKSKNWLYANRFLKYLLDRLNRKQKQFPNEISKETIKQIKTLKEFDNVYTSKAHGFEDAEDYYAKCNSLQFLNKIKLPTLLLNAKNDSFLSQSCFPFEIAETNDNFYFEVPKHGGHVGFYNSSGVFYYEKRALDFLLNW